jgi:hypothetical protein
MYTESSTDLLFAFYLLKTLGGIVRDIVKFLLHLLGYISRFNNYRRVICTRRYAWNCNGRRKLLLGDWTCPDSTDSLEVLDLLGIFNRIDLSVAVN